jgi:hypothetical protein
MVKSQVGNQFDFALNLTEDDHKSLPSGSYTLIVDVVWNKLAQEKPAWKNIRLNV